MRPPGGTPWWDPLMGNPSGTPWWDPLMGNPWWDPLVGPPDGKPLVGPPDEKPLVGPPGGTSWCNPLMRNPWWDPLVGPPGGTSWWDPLVGNPWWDQGPCTYAPVSAGAFVCMFREIQSLDLRGNHLFDLSFWDPTKTSKHSQQLTPSETFNQRIKLTHTIGHVYIMGKQRGGE